MTTITKDLTKEFDIGVTINDNGELTIQIRQEMISPIVSGHQLLSGRHSTWFVIDSEIVSLIKKAIKNNGKWIIKGVD